MATYYVHRNSGNAVFVKEGGFFAQQGGLREAWGRHWTPIEADSIEHARILGDRLLPPYEQVTRCQTHAALPAGEQSNQRTCECHGTEKCEAERQPEAAIADGAGNERKKFEKWHLDTFKQPPSDFEHDPAASRYFQDPVWMAWQFRATLGSHPVLQQPVQDEREAFERWAIEQDMNITRGLRGEYSYMEPAYAWRVWQARAALSETAQPADKTGGES